MSKINNHGVREIDDAMKDEMRAIDYTGANFIDKNYTLVMDNSQIVKYASKGVPMRTLEHRIIFVKKGSVDYELNYDEYHVSESELLLVPASYIITIAGHTSDCSARVLAFNFSDTDYANLVGYNVVKLRLNSNEERVFEYFFQMMHQVLQSPTSGKHDFEHLVLAMLFRIQGLNFEQNGIKIAESKDRKQNIYNQFMQLVGSADIAPRSIAYYADKLNVTDNYLSLVVKAQSGRTVMAWVDLRTKADIIKLLADKSNYTVEQIAERLNFSSSTQMIRVFKKMTGITPVEYRKQHLSQTSSPMQ